MASPVAKLKAGAGRGRGAFPAAVKSLREDWDGAQGSENVGMSNY